MPFNTLTEIIQKDWCCGCSSCANSCTNHLITMEEDAAGFLYPNLKKVQSCIGCDACVRSCPMISSSQIQQHTFLQSVSYHGHVDDINNLKTCSSGGVATALSTSIIKKGGVVFGVRYTQDFTKAIYDRAEDFTGLEDFKGSKYIQPETGISFIEAKKELDSGRLVLFIGLPCVILGLKTFLKKEYANLITCDLICFGVTSPKIAADYIHDLCSTHKSSLTKFSVRYKYEGNWLPPYIRAEFADNTVHMERFYSSDYGWGFTQFSRPSCYQCICKNKGSSADITLGDAHGCREDEVIWNPHGVSVIFVHTAKGTECLNTIVGITLSKITYLHASGGNPYLGASRKKSENYDLFYKYLTSRHLRSACNKTLPLGAKIRKKIPPHLLDAVLQNKLLHLIYKSKQSND